MPKTTDENENILENKLKFIGLNLKRLPSFLKDFEPLNFKPTKSHDDINYKIYKYINVLDIEILLTPLDRTADLEQRYKKAEPLCNYLDTKNKKNAEKFETFMEMLDNLNTEDIEKLDEEQENLNETIPLKVKYENNYIWQIYYAPESNKYFMLVPTTELTSVALFYLIKKQIESKKNKKKFYIFVPITHMEYSGNLYTSLQITDLENYLWYFTKEWPTIFEIFDKKENSTIRVVGKAKVYDNIVSDYIMNFTQKDECIEKYKLLKALFLLSTSFQNDYSFKTAIGEDGELEFKYNSEVINYENLPEFIKSQAKERTDEIKNIIKEKAKKEALLKKLKKKIDEQNAEYFYYIEKQYNINGVFVAAIGIHESNWGTSKIAKNKKNLFGYGAYDSNPYNGAYEFTKYSESIDLISRVLVKYYLNPKGTSIYGGEQAVGTYYSEPTLAGVNKKYASDKNWANAVYKHIKYLYGKL